MGGGEDAKYQSFNELRPPSLVAKKFCWTLGVGDERRWTGYCVVSPNYTRKHTRLYKIKNLFIREKEKQRAKTIFECRQQRSLHWATVSARRDYLFYFDKTTTYEYARFVGQLFEKSRFYFYFSPTSTYPIFIWKNFKDIHTYIFLIQFIDKIKRNIIAKWIHFIKCKTSRLYKYNRTI